MQPTKSCVCADCHRSRLHEIAMEYYSESLLDKLSTTALLEGINDMHKYIQGAILMHSHSLRTS